jgi:3-oxoacyl-[acyl-carrier-protein] synthase II
MATRDHKGRHVIAVTGIGAVTSLGPGVEESWQKLVAGRSGVRRITRFPTDGMTTTIAALIDFDLDVQTPAARTLTERLAHVAAREAVESSGLGRIGDFPGPLFMAVPPVEYNWEERRLIYDRTPPGPGGVYDRLIAGARHNTSGIGYFPFSRIADTVADAFGTKGLPIAVQTACASGATAIQIAFETLRRGEVESALVVGTEGFLHEEAVIRFSLLSALSTANEFPEKAAKPFSGNRDGFVMGEGAAALVLEDYDAARARGATIYGIIRGCGEKADDFHRTRSKPDASAIIGAIRRAVDDAGIEPDEVRYVNAHGTGTEENDKMEAFALTSVFGEHMKSLPVSSNKSIVGHTLTAAGALEAVFSIMTIRNGILPPTINYEVPDPDIQLDVVPNVARPASVDIVLSNSFGFGGQNVSLIFAAEPA